MDGSESSSDQRIVAMEYEVAKSVDDAQSTLGICTRDIPNIKKVNAKYHYNIIVLLDKNLLIAFFT